jgi:iron complex outermembrane receptor protein
LLLKRAAPLSFLLLLCAAFSPLAIAEDAGELSEEAYLGDMPTVLTVSRIAQPLNESPSAVTVIDEETIRASGIVDLPDIFRLVPGMYVGHNAGYFHTVNPTVSYHGLTDAYSRRMQVLVDGRSVYSPIYGGVQWSDIPLAIEDIARIEVTRGPNSASHGANSFLGVINIVTKHASETLGNTAVLTSGGDRKGLTVRHGGKQGDLQYRVTAGLKNDDGLQERNDDKRIRMLNFRADYRLNARDELEFQFGYNGGDREEGMLEEDALLFLPRTKRVSNRFEQLSWRRTLSPESEFRIQAYHTREESDDFMRTADLNSALPAPILVEPRILRDHDVVTDRYDLEAQHTFSPTVSTRLVWGGSVRLDRTRAPFFLGTRDAESFRLGRLFGHLEWTPLPRLVLNAGAMLEDNSLTGTDLTPRASANFKLAPGHTLRASISTATRTPTLLEEKFNTRNVIPTVIPGITILNQLYLSTGGLPPERITSREIGYQGNFGRLSLDGRLFHDKIRDVIDGYTYNGFPHEPGLTPFPSYTASYRSSSDINLHGFEAQAQLRLGTHTRVIGNYSHVRINPDMDSNFTSEGEERRFGQLSESMPVNSFSLLAWHRFGSGWMGTVGYYQMGETKMPGDGNQVNSARHWDLRLARSFKLGNTHNELSLTSQNALDHDYQEFARYNTVQRRTYLQYRVDF